VRYNVALARGQHEKSWTFLDTAATVFPAGAAVSGYVVLHNIVTDSHRAEARAALARIDTRFFEPAATSAWYAAVRESPEESERAFTVLGARSWPDSIMADAIATGLRGVVALRQGDTVRARDLLFQSHANHKRRASPHRVLMPGVFLSLTMAQLEVARGNFEGARLALADIYPPHEGVPFLGDAEEVRAKVALALGDTAGALIAYRNIVSIWKDSDPVIQPRVAAAREAIARLEKR
jgi:hypothetical protein